MSEGLRHVLCVRVSAFRNLSQRDFLARKNRLLRFETGPLATRPLCVSGDKSRERGGWVRREEK
jgi:hypothetical protein